MFHRKSKKQKKLEEQNTIQNISAPINLFNNSSFSASQPTYSFNNGFPSPHLGLNNIVSSVNDPSYSLSQPVNSPLNSPLLSSSFSVGSPSKLFIKPKENRLNSLTSPPPPLPHNLPSAIFGYSANAVIDHNSQLPSPPLHSSRSGRPIDRPSRSVSVRNQDFVYSSSPSNSSNNIGISRGRSKNRDLDSYDSSNNSFINFSSSTKHSEKDSKTSNKEEKKSEKREEKKSEKENESKKSEKDSKKSEKESKRSHRERPVSKSQKPPKPFERVQSRYDIKNRAAGDYSMIADMNYTDRLNRKYGFDYESGSKSFAIYDPTGRSRTDKSSKGKSKYELEGTNIEILREYLIENKLSDTSFSTIDLQDGRRQSITKNTTVTKKVVEESPISNYNKNPILKNSSLGRDFGIHVDSKKNRDDYSRKTSHDHDHEHDHDHDHDRANESFSYSRSHHHSRSQSRIDDPDRSISFARTDIPRRSSSRTRPDDPDRSISYSRLDFPNRSSSRSRRESPNRSMSYSRSRQDSPNRSMSYSRSRNESANRSMSYSRSEFNNRSSSHSRQNSPGRSKSRHRYDSPTRSKSRSRYDSPTRSKSRHRYDSPGRSKSRHRYDSPDRSKSRHRYDSPDRSKSRSRYNSPGRSKSRSRYESPTRSKSHSRYNSPGRSKSRTRYESPDRSRSRTRSDRSSSRHHHTSSHNRTKSKSKPFNMNDFFSNLESEIDLTINATFNTAESLIASKKDDVVEVVEEDFTEPIVEEDKNDKEKEEGKKKRISNDVLGLVLGINKKDDKPRQEIIIEEEPDTEEENEGEEKPPIIPVAPESKLEENKISPLIPTDEARNNDAGSKNDNVASQEAKLSVTTNEKETNDKKSLKINTNTLDLAKPDNNNLLPVIDEKPLSPINVIARSDSKLSSISGHSRKQSTEGPIDLKNSKHTRNISIDSKHSRNRSIDSKHSRNQSGDGMIKISSPPLPVFSQPLLSQPLSLFSQPTSPTSPTGPFSENGDPEITFDGALSQDDNGAIANVSSTGKTGVLKSFLPSDIADIIENEQDVDTLNISPDYRDNFIEYLTSQKYDDPTKDDFITAEGYYSWEEKTEKRPFVDVMAQLVDYRFSEEWVEEQEIKKRMNKSIVKAPEETVEIPIIVKIIQAKDLVTPKDGKTRNPYCELKYNGSTFHTEKCENTQEPYWNQHLEIKAKNLADSITIIVWDKKDKEKKKIWKKDSSDEFLGQVKISIQSFINESVRVGYISKWYDLEKRKDKKDKNAGGKILIEAGVGDVTDIKEEKSLNEDAQDDDSDYEKLQAQLINCKVSFKHLFKILLKSCLDHDLIYINDKINSNSTTSEILSDEAKILLKVFSKQWVLGDSFLVISYLEETFNMYVNNKIPIHVVVATFDVLYDYMNIDGWLPAYEHPHLIDLLEEMITYHSRQVCHYREYFPKGQPEGVLNNAIYLWRIIFKSKIYRDNHPELPISFREEIRTQMVKHIEIRYTKLLGLSSPFVENTEDILIGLAKLADLIVKDIEEDLNYYQEVFKKEVNIVRLSSQIYLKSFIKELENNSERLASEEALESSKATFELYRRVRLMDRQYASLVPSFKRISMGSGFNIEKWFNDFVIAWLKVQQERTLVWVKTAVATDTFEKMSDTQPFSTSVIDLFEIMFEELDLIKGLEWSDTEQYTEFLTTFARIVTKAIEQYCDAMEENEMKKEETDIDNQSCVKLSNIEKAIEKLNEVFNKMKELNVIEDNRPISTNTRRFTEDITGTFSMEVIYAENLKPCNKNGLSNPYVVIKVPEDNNELIKTSIINDSINPRWDETFQVFMVPTKSLEVCIYNKTSFLSSDEVIGKKTIHFSTNWCDHQTHELIVKLEPQGRLLIRITMDGEGEDLSFFFKKSKQRLIRTSHDFIRELAYRITPYVKEVYTKLMKSNESQNNVQLANAYIMGNVVPLTVSGRVANKGISQAEIDKELQPITDYLNKNFATLCTNLSAKMAQKVIIEIWNEILGMLESSMIPPLYGAIERDRKILNIRQISIIVYCLDILFEFFHSDGDELGIPKPKLLENPVYDEIKLITRDYTLTVSELIDNYEKTKKIYLLRLLRVHGHLDESKNLRDKASKFVDKEIDIINNSD